MSFDPQLDALLRDVPLPDGLVARLQSSLAPSDQELDAQLQAVEAPVGLLDSLRDIPLDEPTEEALRDVPVSFELVWRTRRKTLRARAGYVLRRAADLSAALALFVVLSSALWSIATAFVVPLFPNAGPSRELPFVVAANEPLSFAGAPGGGNWHFVAADAPLAGNGGSGEGAGFGPVALNIDSPDVPLWPSDGPDVEWISAVRRGMDPLDNVVLLRWGVLGYPQLEEDITPALESPRLPAAAGVEFPPVRGYDRAFVVRHGVFPPINPAAHRSLSTLELPLTTAADSFHVTRQLAGQGQWPDPSQVRTEEFLAAMDYRFPPADRGELAIRTAAGPSPFGPPSAGLLQIAALAGELPPRDDGGSHLVLAIDMSRSMARDQRLELVQCAVNRLLTRLRPEDRLSLVVFDDELRQVVQGATLADAGPLGRLIAELRPAGGTDLAEGLQQAAAAALAGNASAGRAAKIVLITDSQAVMPRATEELMDEVLAAAGAGGVKLAVLDVGDQPQLDETLQGWARMMGGEICRPESINEAQRLLVEALYDRTAVVASEARMRVHFNPRVVAAYRLIGHEANPLGSLEAGDRAVSLRAGEAATCLLEIWFQSNDQDDVGEVELTWRDAAGRMQRRRQPISRLQFAPTWQQSPLTLQQAALAAQTAEVLRGARTSLRELNVVPQHRETIDRLAAMAQQAHRRLQNQPQFQEFVALIRQLEAAK